jgi:hypothetical protein
MARKYEIKDVPEIELDAQIQILKEDGVTDVSYEKQTNGLYTIVATYPD